MRKLFFVIISPILFFPSLVLVFHGLLPSIWRKCILPTVVNLREMIKNGFIQSRRIKERIRSIYKDSLSIFEKRRFAIIRLIRLISEDDIGIMRKESWIIYRKGVCIFS